MSKFVADHLPDSVLAMFSTASALDRADNAIVICTIDEHGWPHPAMLSTLDIAARDARNVRLAMRVTSRTTRNLKANGILSMILVDETAVFYIKGDALLVEPSMTVAPHDAKFNLRVDSVLQDNPADDEQALVVSGIKIRRPRMDEAAARALLDELLR